MSTPAFELKESPGKGLGMFATRDIAVGDRIVSEPPLFILRCFVNLGINKVAMVFDPAIDELKPDERALFFSFIDRYSPDSPTAVGIFQTNGIPLDGGACGIFPNICRINHSCVPNGLYCCDAEGKQEFLHATLPIAKGEEILASYIDPAAVRSARQTSLLDDWNFTCTCKACDVVSSTTSDARRARIADITKNIDSIAERNPVRVYELAKDRIRYLDAEGIADQHSKAEIHRQAHRMCVIALDYATARRQLGLAIRNSLLAQGEQPNDAIALKSIRQIQQGILPSPVGAKRIMPMLCDACGSICKSICQGCLCAVYCDATCANEHDKWHGPVCRATRDAQNK